MLYPLCALPDGRPNLELAAALGLRRLVARELDVRDLRHAWSAVQVLDERVDGGRIASRFALDVVATIGDPWRVSGALVMASKRAHKAACTSAWQQPTYSR